MVTYNRHPLNKRVRTTPARQQVAAHHVRHDAPHPSELNISQFVDRINKFSSNIGFALQKWQKTVLHAMYSGTGDLRPRRRRDQYTLAE